MMEKQIIFIDTETTGFGSDARIVQIAWLISNMDGKEIKSADHIIKPVGFEIPEHTTEIHGITTEYAMDVGEDLEFVMLGFLSDLSSCNILVGHNISYDVRMVTYEFARIGAIYNFDMIDKVCTMSKSTDYCALPSDRKNYKKPKLKELHMVLFGEDFKDAHDAMGDVMATAKCYWKLRDLGIINSIIL